MSEPLVRNQKYADKNNRIVYEKQRSNAPHVPGDHLNTTEEMSDAEEGGADERAFGIFESGEDDTAEPTGQLPSPRTVIWTSFSQYLYFCTSKASKASRRHCRANGPAAVTFRTVIFIIGLQKVTCTIIE